MHDSFGVYNKILKKWGKNFYRNKANEKIIKKIPKKKKKKLYDFITLIVCGD